MIVILTEKPSAARNFTKALGGKEGIYNGEKYKIVSARGHLLKLSDPSNQVPKKLADKYKTWCLQNLPWQIEEIAGKKQLIQGTEDTIKTIGYALKNADEVTIATDVDPSGEGELLAWEILMYCKWEGKTTRMYFTDESAKSIQKAFIDRKVIEDINADGDYIKADTRSKWDYMSMQFTRAATCIARQQGYNIMLRQGRLKSVMVYMVGEQLKAIAEYKKIPFYEVRFKDENGNIYMRKESEDFRFALKEDVDIKAFKDSRVVIDSKREKAAVPGKLLDLAGLSSILAARGYKPKQILDTYQKMYEDQIVSYPRTEDKEITPEQFEESGGALPDFS